MIDDLLEDFGLPKDISDAHRPDTSTVLTFLAKEVLADRAFFVTGAGVSVGTRSERAQGYGLPLARQLATELAAVHRVPESDVDHSDLGAVAAWIDRTYGRATLLEFLKQRLSTAGRHPLLAHRRLASLPIRLIATTNYDDLHEKAFEERGISTTSIVGQDQLPLISDVGERRAVVLKMHGDLRSMKNVVITPNDFTTFFEELPSLVAALRHLLSTRIVVFIGHSLYDSNVRRLIREVREAFPEAVRRAFAVQFRTAPEDRAFWDDLGVTLLEEDATEFLGRLALEVNKLDLEQSVSTAVRDAIGEETLSVPADENAPQLTEMTIQSQVTSGSVTAATETVVRHAKDLAAASKTYDAAEFFLRAAEMMQDRDASHRAASYCREALSVLDNETGEGIGSHRLDLLRLRAHVRAAQAFLDDLSWQAEEHLKSAMEIAESLDMAGDREVSFLALEARITMARFNYLLKDDDEQVIADLEALAENSTLPEERKGQVWLELAILHWQRGEWDRTDNALEAARGSDQSQIDPYFLLQVEKHQAMAYALRGDWQEAVHAYDNCRNLLSLLPPGEASQEAADIHHNLGLVRSRISNLAGLKDQERVIDIRLDTGFQMDKASRYEYYGLKHCDRGKLNVALREYVKAEVCHERTANLARLLDLKVRLGRLYLNSGHARWLLPALKTFIESGDVDSVQKSCEPLLTIRDPVEMAEVFDLVLSTSKSVFEQAGRLAALGFLADSAPPERVAEIVTLLLDAVQLPVKHEEDVRIKRTAVQALTKYVAQVDQDQASAILACMLNEIERQQPWQIREHAVAVIEHMIIHETLPRCQSEKVAVSLRQVCESGEAIIEQEARRTLIRLAEFSDGEGPRCEALTFLRSVPGHWSTAMQVVLDGEIEDTEIIDAVEGAIEGLKSVVTVEDGKTTAVAGGIMAPRWLAALRNRIPEHLLDDVVDALLGAANHPDIMIADRILCTSVLQKFVHLISDEAVERVSSSMLRLLRDPTQFEGAFHEVVRQGYDPLATFQIRTGEPADLQAVALRVLGTYLTRLSGETREQTIQYVLESLHDPSTRIRGATAWSFASMASEFPKQILHDVYLLLFALTNDSDGWVRAGATHSLGKIFGLADSREQTNILKRLRHLTTDRDRRVRQSAARAAVELTTSGEPGESSELVAETFQILRNDISSMVRQAATLSDSDKG